MGVGDWIVLGDSCGQLFGFQFYKRGNRLVPAGPGASGRFRNEQNKHDNGIPVGALTHTYDSGMLDSNRFLSLGSNGRILIWKLGRNGWHADEAVVPDVGRFDWRIHETAMLHTASSLRAQGNQESQFCAAHSSRLVPHVVVVADWERKIFKCCDSTAKQQQAVTDTPDCFFTYWP